MPNWCDNTLRVTGDVEALKRFIVDITNEDESITILKNLVPFPTELEGNDITDKDGNVIARAFSDAGYSWCLRNWGTKWGDCETEITVNDPDHLVIRFQSAWSPALEGLGRISTMFPTLTFQTDWVEEGMQSIGAASFQNGNESIYDVPESDFPSWEEDEDGETDWQEMADAIDQLRDIAIASV
jgi:hypothetical protein